MPRHSVILLSKSRGFSLALLCLNTFNAACDLNTGATYTPEDTQLPGLSSSAKAEFILEGMQAYDVSKLVLTGTMKNFGEISISEEFLGPGFVTYISNPDLTKICTGTKILGNDGTAICQSGTSLSVALATDMIAGKEAWNQLGQKVTGTIASRGDWDLKAVFPGAGLYSSISSAPVATQLCSSGTGGQPVAGVNGSAICQSGTSANVVVASDMLAGKEAWNQAGQKLTGSMLNRGSLDLRLTYPGSGYVSGLSNAPVAAQLCSAASGGQNVLGVVGTATCLSGTSINLATAADMLAGKEAWSHSGQKITGTLISRGVWDLKVAFPGAGNYTTVSSAPLATQLCNTATGGQSVAGVSGSAVCQSGSSINIAAGSDVLSGKDYWDTSGVKKSGTAVQFGAINLNTSALPSGPGFFSSIVLSLAQSDVCSGKSILGQAGTAVCSAVGVFSDYTASNLHRSPATTQMTLSSEKSSTSYAAGYREIPDVSKDDDGQDASSPVIKAVRPTVICGTTQNSVASRISDCATKNGSSATWAGATKGNSGEASWKLVTRSNAGKEVWRDERTGLLWSDKIADNTWCKASGNSQNSAQDSSGICDPALNASQSNSPVSYCSEVSGLSPAAGGENWTTGVYIEAKGGMGKVSTASNPSLRWRLPTKNDWQQADIDGIRFVLPNMAGGFWAASLSSQFRERAWFYYGDGGYMLFEFRDSLYGVRCVGR